MLASGGLKSAVAARRVAHDHDLVLLHIDYGQAATLHERRALKEFASDLPHVRLIGMKLPYTKALGSLATSDQPGMELEPGEELPPTATKGLVPVMITVGVQCALHCGARTLVTGMIQPTLDDGSLLNQSLTHPDRARELLHLMDVMIELSVGQRNHPLSLEMPLIDLTFDETIKLGLRLNVPFEKTRTCAAGQAAACGQCPPCVARAQAFLVAGVGDPLATGEPGARAGAQEPG